MPLLASAQATFGEEVATDNVDVVVVSVLVGELVLEDLGLLVHLGVESSATALSVLAVLLGELRIADELDHLVVFLHLGSQEHLQ